MKITSTHNVRTHTLRYVDVRSFSFNCLELNENQQMVAVTSSVTGKRVAYEVPKA